MLQLFLLDALLSKGLRTSAKKQTFTLLIALSGFTGIFILSSKAKSFSLSPIKELALILNTTAKTDGKTYKSFDDALFHYAKTEYIYPSLITVSNYKKDESFLINAPYLFTKVDKAIFKQVFLEHVKEFSFSKHLPKRKSDLLYSKSKKIIKSLNIKNYFFAFDGGAETVCESPTHRVLIFEGLTGKLKVFDLDDCL